MDNNAQGKVALDISLEDVKFSEDHSDIIAGKVTAQATGYTNDEEINPIVFEGTDVSLTGAGGGGSGGGTVFNITLIPCNNGVPMATEFTELMINGYSTIENIPDLGISTSQGYADIPIEFPVKIIAPGGQISIGEITLTDSGGITNWNQQEPIELSTNATWNSEVNQIVVTGDCTIKYNAWQD